MCCNCFTCAILNCKIRNLFSELGGFMEKIKFSLCFFAILPFLRIGINLKWTFSAIFVSTKKK